MFGSFFCGEVPRRYNTESIYAHTVIVVCSGAQSNIEKHYLNRFVSLFLVHTPDKMRYRISSKASFPFGCFQGQLKKNNIDKTGPIVGGALKPCFLVPAPSKQINMKKMKIVLLFFLHAFFCFLFPHNKPKQLYYATQFPTTSPPENVWFFMVFLE